MLKYFKMPKGIVDEYEGYEEIQPKELEQRINNYTSENNLRIVNIAPVGYEGVFVLFERVGE